MGLLGHLDGLRCELRGDEPRTQMLYIIDRQKLRPISTASFGRLSKLAGEQIAVILGKIWVIESYYVMLYWLDRQNNR